MGKKKKRNSSLMKDWPSDAGCGIRYEDLIYPLKKIFFDGYKVERLPIKQFVYTGYNIGKEDRLYCPTPEERFSARWLENEAKFKRTLLDNVLMIAFQLGMEQGRRDEYYKRYDNDLLLDILDSRTATIKKLRAKLGLYEPEFIEAAPVPVEKEGKELLIDEEIPENDAHESTDNKQSYLMS